MNLASALRALPLLLATLGLIGSVVAAVWLTSAVPSHAGVPDTELLTAQGDYETYGGDAYTGIQNAAADTEVAVIEAGNASMEQARENLATQLEQAGEQWRHLYTVLAMLVVAVGLATFTLALQRYLYSVIPARPRGSRLRPAVIDRRGV